MSRSDLPEIPTQRLELDDELAERVADRLAAWDRDELPRRIAERDPTVWSEEPVPELVDRLGWLDLPETMVPALPELAAFGREVGEAGVRWAVLLGMGGSSLAPEVFQRTFGPGPLRPEVVVLDSTHPDWIRAVGERVDLARALFIVSSKSGTTTETTSLYRHFWSALEERAAAGGPPPGRRFLAVTDPGTPLAEAAESRGFLRLFEAAPDVGGRYSALSHFGLVPAALLGVDLPGLLARARAMQTACGPDRPAAESPALELAAVLTEAAGAGRDKLTLVTTAGLRALPDWIEQLVAESTGKDGGGIVPVVEEPERAPDEYGGDRLFVATLLAGDLDRAAVERRLSRLAAAGHPVVRIDLQRRLGLGAELYRWEYAVAAAGAGLGIHPFDQPDVQLAKELTRAALVEGEGGSGPALEQVSAADAGGDGELAAAVERWLADAPEDGYVAIQAYLAPTEGVALGLGAVKAALVRRGGLAVTAGYGPRFLHSTGQLHKGGPDHGLFLQLVDEPAGDQPVPETDYTFGRLIAGQALGDGRALVQRGRRLLRVRLGRDTAAALDRLAAALGGSGG